MTSSRDIGVQGEERAAALLKKKGYRILEKNYRSPFGEIDIVAENKGFLVFIEVKRRTSSSFGDALEAVNKDKRRRIVRSALFYLKAHRCPDRRVRFDVVGIDGENMKIIPHAFMAEE